MAGRAKGQVLERHWKAGRGYALRFHAYGERQYLTLGLEAEGWDRDRAEEELDNVLADVRRGIWTPPQRRRALRDPREAREPGAGIEEDGEELFGSFARGLVAARRGQVSEAHHAYLDWGLAHLLPYFADRPLAAIDVEAVDAYRAHKVAEAESLRWAIERRKPKRDERGQLRRPLSASSINKTLEVLQWVLGFAHEYKRIAENPAAGRRRRLPAPRRRPVHLDSAEQIEALLDAAAELDRDPYWRCADRLAIIGTLILAGPRAEELCNLLWRDVDLAGGRIHIGRSKTQAGLREIELGPRLRDILAAHKARAYRSGPDDLAFPTATGGRRDGDNLRNRILAAALERGDQLLETRGQSPLPPGITPHKLRHTFASALIAGGEDPASVMAQLGHADPKFTLRVYTHIMRRSPGERERLRALVRGEAEGAVQPEVPDATQEASRR